jgi:hypothetical protein
LAVKYSILVAFKDAVVMFSFIWEQRQAQDGRSGGRPMAAPTVLLKYVAGTKNGGPMLASARAARR